MPARQAASVGRGCRFGEDRFAVLSVLGMRTLPASSGCCELSWVPEIEAAPQLSGGRPPTSPPSFKQFAATSSRSFRFSSADGPLQGGARWDGTRLDPLVAKHFLAVQYGEALTLHWQGRRCQRGRSDVRRARGLILCLVRFWCPL